MLVGTLPSPALMPRPQLLARAEARAVAPLALAVALRMLGLFLLLPVLSVYVLSLPGGSLELAGLAIGIYGLGQAVMLLPLGWLSDRIGRRRVLVAGLLVFAAGGVVAALATSPALIIAGRALQGMGAVTAVVIAAIADVTSARTRPQAMALMGIGIALAFAAAIVVASPLAALLGVPALFALTALLGLLAAAAVALTKLPPPRPAASGGRIPLLALLPLGLGVFVVHFALAALFVLMPPLLAELAGSQGNVGLVYLASFVASVALVVPALIFPARATFAAAAALVAAALALIPAAGSLAALTALLALFFAGFNYLEATLPSRATALAPAGNVGAVSAGYAIFQALGAFVGAAGAGQLAQYYNYLGSHLAAGLIVLWLIFYSVIKFKASARSQRES